MTINTELYPAADDVMVMNSLYNEDEDDDAGTNGPLENDFGDEEGDDEDKEEEESF